MGICDCLGLPVKDRGGGDVELGGAPIDDIVDIVFAFNEGDIPGVCIWVVIFTKSCISKDLKTPV